MSTSSWAGYAHQIAIPRFDFRKQTDLKSIFFNLEPFGLFLNIRMEY